MKRTITNTSDIRLRNIIHLQHCTIQRLLKFTAVINIQSRRNQIRLIN